MATRALFATGSVTPGLNPTETATSKGPSSRRPTAPCRTTGPANSRATASASAGESGASTRKTSRVRTRRTSRPRCSRTLRATDVPRLSVNPGRVPTSMRVTEGKAILGFEGAGSLPRTGWHGSPESGKRGRRPRLSPGLREPHDPRRPRHRPRTRRPTREGRAPGGAAGHRDPEDRLPALRASERPRPHRPRGPQGAHRGRERLVPRGLEERAPREDRVRPPLRAPDVQRQRALQRRLVQGDRAHRRHGPQRHHQPRPDQLLPERPDAGARHGALDGVGPHGPPARRRQPGPASTSSAAW